MVKKFFGLFANYEINEDGVVFPNSLHLICASSNMDKLLEYRDILQKAADLLSELLPSLNYHTVYVVDEVNFLDL